MLILTMDVGQKIKIGRDVIIMMLETKGSVIRLGLKVPDHVTVSREEVYQPIAPKEK